MIHPPLTRRLVAGTVLIAAVFSGSSAHAEVLAQYTFTGSSFASVDTQLLSEASDLSAGAGAGLAITTSWGNAAPAGAIQNIGRSNAPKATEAAAISTDTYVTFTLTLSEGYEASLASLTLDARKNDASGSSQLFIRSGQDNYASDLYLSAPLSNTITTSPTISLTDPAFQSITGSITFRIYGFNGDAGSIRFDNLTLNGSIAPSSIPEPSMCGILVGIAAFGSVVLRRRSRRSLGQ